MLALHPLSGLQAALKRRGSKTAHDFTRRGSISVYSTYSLPSSKSSLRRFSSFEELAPIFNQVVSDSSERKAVKHAESTAVPKFLLRRRASVFAALYRPGSEPAAGSTAGLDAQLERIKGQLERLQGKSLEMSRRVDSLHSSVESLCSQQRPASAPRPREPPAPAKNPRHCTPSLKADSGSGLLRVDSGSSLGAIHEECRELVFESDADSGCLDSSGSDSDSESFEDYCNSVLTRLGHQPSSSPLSPATINFPPIDPQSSPLPPAAMEEIDPKSHLIPNNLFCPSPSRSTPSLHIIRNDLSLHDSSPFLDEKRLSVISDSVLYSSQYRDSIYQ